MSRNRVPPPDGLARLIAEELKALRSRRGFTLDELELASGVSRSTIWRIETGKSDPNVEQMTRLSRALGLDLPRLVQRVFDNYVEETGERLD